MTKVIRIEIEGSSGYCDEGEAYNDKLVIEKDSISYNYIPAEESETNPIRKWSYKTNSPIFEKLYRDVISLLPAVINTDEEEVFCTDVGDYKFTIFYAEGNKWRKTFYTIGSTFCYLFIKIRQMVPECEYTPALLLLMESRVFISRIDERKWGLFYEDESGEIKELIEDFNPVVFATEEEAKAKLSIIEAERESENSAEPFSLGEAQLFIDSHKWKFATTYAKTAPHEYLVKKWLNEDERHEFERLVQTINENSVTGYFYGHINNYFILGDHYYWYMNYPENLAVDLINRTTIDYLEFRDGAYYYKEKI